MYPVFLFIVYKRVSVDLMKQLLAAFFGNPCSVVFSQWGMQSCTWTSWRVRSWLCLGWGVKFKNCTRVSLKTGTAPVFCWGWNVLEWFEVRFKYTSILYVYCVYIFQAVSLSSFLHCCRLCSDLKLQDSDHHEDECVMMRRHLAEKSFRLPSGNVSNCRRLLELEEELREISGDAVTGESRGRREQHMRIITLLRWCVARILISEGFF